MNRPLNTREAANLIERFLEGRSNYPQEWNDFVEGMRVAPEVEPFRRRCDVLDPLVNCLGGPDVTAVTELRNVVQLLRELPG
jgi:hypothetical protein